MKIVYHGAGYIGFTEAAYFAKAGKDVLIYDVNKNAVDAINAKRIPVYGVDEFLRFNPFTRAGNIRATNRFEDTLSSEVHIIAVPTEKNGEAHLEIVKNVILRILEEVVRGNSRANTILIESTVSPGFTDELLKDDFFKMESLMYKPVGVLFAICPRRDWFVDPNDDVETTPRIVGGIDEKSTARAVDVLSTVSNTIHTTGYREAEAVKAFENAIFYHSITFGLEFTKRYEHILDARKVLQLQGTHWRLYPLYPSAGIAGYCVPMGLRYLDMPDVKEQDQKIEKEWRALIGKRAVDFFNQHKIDDVIVYGISEKEKTRVPHFSPAFDMIKNLSDNGFEPIVVDCDYHTNEIEKWLVLDTNARRI